MQEPIATPPGTTRAPLPWISQLLLAFLYGILIAATPSARSQSNDNFAGRLPVTGPAGSVVSSSSFATQEANEPRHAGVFGGHSLWWTWTAPATGIANFSTFGSEDTGSGYLPV